MSADIQQENQALWGQADNTWEGMTFDPIPKGTYSMVIDTAKFDYTNPKEGMPKLHILISFTVLDGQYKGRKVRHKLWIQSENQDYVKTCWAFVKNLYNTLQVQMPAQVPTDQDLFAFVNKPCNVTVEVRNNEFNGETRQENEVIKIAPFATVQATNNQPAQGSVPQTDDAPF